MEHRVVLLLEGPADMRRVELIRDGPTLADAVVRCVRDVELSGRRVLGVEAAGRQGGVAAAADLILRLRRVGLRVSEEEMALLLELLAL